MKSLLVLLLLFFLTIGSAAAEPEPSWQYYLDQFLNTQPFSIQSSYQSWVRWEGSGCYYWTGVVDSVTRIKVEDAHCTLRTYTKQYKTITSVDKMLLDRLNAAKTGSSTSGLGKIGDKCTTASDCGLTCEGRGSTCEPRCLDGGQGKVCFAGEGNSQTGYLYSSTCGRDSDCETGQRCVAGICTISESTGQASGNPPIQNSDGTTRYTVTPDDICRTTDCVTKCSDGTPVFTCSPTLPKYCFKEGGKGVLKDYAGVCGCPDDQRLDFNGLRCCDPKAGTCFNCEQGEVKVKDCPDGSQVTTVVCGSDGHWDPTGAVCPIKGDNSSGIGVGVLVLALLGVVILFLLGSWAFRRTK